MLIEARAERIKREREVKGNPLYTEKEVPVNTEVQNVVERQIGHNLIQTEYPDYFT